MGETMGTPVKILISVDIKDDRPHKAIKLYTVNGTALGYGEMIVNSVVETNDLFTHLPGYTSYSATIDLDKLMVKQKNGTTKPVPEIKTIDKDVNITDDPDEDEWVAKSLRQLKEAKSIISLTTESELRDDYKKMKHAKAKSGDKEEVVARPPEVTAEIIDKRGQEIFKMIDEDTNPELEPEQPKATVYTPVEDYTPLKVYLGDNGMYYMVEGGITYTHDELKRKQGVQQLALDNLAKFHEKKEESVQLPLSEEIKPEPFNLDNFLKGI